MLSLEELEQLRADFAQHLLNPKPVLPGTELYASPLIVALGLAEGAVLRAASRRGLAVYDGAGFMHDEHRVAIRAAVRELFPSYREMVAWSL